MLIPKCQNLQIKANSSMNWYEKDVIFIMPWAWDKEKIWVTNRNGTYELPQTGQML